MYQFDMDLKHIFIMQVNGVNYKDPTVYNDREFTMLMDQYDWQVPYNLRAYHFRYRSRPNHIIDQMPEIFIPIYELTRPISNLNYDGTKLYYKGGPKSGITVLRRYWDYVLAESEQYPGGLLALVDGKQYSYLCKYTARPITLDDARSYIKHVHRHNKPPHGHKFSIALDSTNGFVVGVLVASTPIARHQNDGRTLELNRVCVDSRYHNVCSSLMGRAIRIGKEMGYTRFLSYTLPSESGSSLKAAGFKKSGIVKGNPNGWNSSSRKRARPSNELAGDKIRWEMFVVT